jgi:2-polyprenyl-6-methoxyphenol hydroxylase-like FAD-dependent oxidoreductase
LDPLYSVDHAVRVGFALLNPRLDRWVYGKNRRVVLVGDAAHPPVPYVGQGAQMGIEDAGTLVLLIKALCYNEESGTLDFSKFGKATEIYERLRIPRTSSILDCSKSYGDMQERRTHRSSESFQDLLIQGEVMMNDTVSEMLPGATFNYAEDVRRALKREEKKKRSLRHSSSTNSNLGRDQMKEALAQLWGGTMPFV